MDQKNTIVKCKAHPDCLFNHNGVCDNYVISIGKDYKCDCYVATATCQDCEFYEDKKLLQNQCTKDGSYYLRTAPTCDNFQERVKRGQRAKCNFYEDTCDDKIAVKMKIAELNKPNKNKSTIKEVMPECDLPVCDWSCRYALRSGPSFNPDLWCDKMKAKPAVGLFCSDYEEEK